MPGEPRNSNRSRCPQCGATVLSTLTEREKEVVALVGEGLSNQEIALRLTITVHTVKAHVGNIFGKLGYYCRTQVAVYAITEGLCNDRAEEGAEGSIEGAQAGSAAGNAERLSDSALAPSGAVYVPR